MSEFNTNDRIITYIDDDGNTLQEVLISSGTLKIDNVDVLSVTTNGEVQFSNPVLLDLATPASGSSAVNKDYVDGLVYSSSGTLTYNYTEADSTLSGSLASYTDNSISTYSGAADDRYVNTSGDTMSGSLILSGSDILTSVSGGSSIGSPESPFNNIYVNNYYDDGNDPVYGNQLVNKNYLETQLVEGTKQVFSYVFTASTNYFTSVNSSTLTVVGHLIFRGSDLLGVPTSIKSILGHSSTGVVFQLFDLTNNNIICQVTSNISSPTLVDCGTISNIPTGEAILQFKLRRIGNNGQGRIYSLDMRVG